MLGTRIFLYTNNWFYFLPETYFFLFSFCIFVFILFAIISFNKTYYYFSKFVLVVFLVFSIFLFCILWNSAIYYFIFDFSFSSDPTTFLSKVFFIFFLCIFLWLFKNYIFIKTIFMSEFYLLLVFSILGLFLILTSTDFLTFYISLELYSLSIYGVMSVVKTSLSFIESAIKYFIISSFSSGLILFGISVIYFFTAATNFYDLSLFIHSYELFIASTDNSIYYLTAIFLIFLGFAIKLSAAPFHIWYIDIYANTLQILNLFFLILPKFVFLIFLLKLYILPLFEFFYLKFFVFMFVFFCCLFFGIFGAIYETNIRKIFIYSSVFNLSFFLCLFNFFNVYSLMVFFLFSLVYFGNVFGGFSFLLSLLNFTTFRFYKNLNSVIAIFGSYPALAAYSSILFLSSAGLPPFIGFFSKFLVFFGLVDLGMLYVFLFLFLFSIFGFFYYIRFIKLFFINSFKNFIFILPVSFANSFLIVGFSFFNTGGYFLLPGAFSFLGLWFFFFN